VKYNQIFIACLVFILLDSMTVQADCDLQLSPMKLWYIESPYYAESERGTEEIYSDTVRPIISKQKSRTQ
jgi:hypothetical protein